ncbi:hypothetical protein QR680_005235 [Steinernema hermaphroditum]|uniref:Uncharacterized protein n=1 Tax=Steinernema hermaphroditum TaxID=289476 RepID=A0AA39LVA2_9BILA|nr:hypothetical protein QR680_005235 [Steinernema hermaphroditum]
MGRRNDTVGGVKVEASNGELRDQQFHYECTLVCNSCKVNHFESERRLGAGIPVSPCNNTGQTRHVWVSELFGFPDQLIGRAERTRRHRSCEVYFIRHVRVVLCFSFLLLSSVT